MTDQQYWTKKDLSMFEVATVQIQVLFPLNLTHKDRTTVSCSWFQESVSLEGGKKVPKPALLLFQNEPLQFSQAFTLAPCKGAECVAISETVLRV